MVSPIQNKNSTKSSVNPNKSNIDNNDKEAGLENTLLEKSPSVRSFGVNAERVEQEEVCEWIVDGNEEEEDRIFLGLIGKLWSERTLNSNAFMTTIKNVWVLQQGVDINVIGKNLFQFLFYHWRDKEKVLKGQPWHCDKVALLLTDMEIAQKPFDLQFYALPIWVRMWTGTDGSFRVRDAWIGGNGTGKLITHVRVLDENTKVEALLDNESHTWRRDILSDILFPIDVERVMQIPISVFGAPDERVWTGTDGSFRVRDVYSLALRHQLEGSSSNDCDPMWKHLWNLQIFPKAKLFLWRAMWDILPHNSNMRNKGIDNVGLCIRCGLPESNTHALRDCTWSKQVWQLLLKANDLPQEDMTFREWFSMLML